MGKVIRIEDDSIRSMRKTLDDLPDKRLGKPRDEATELLFEHLKKAMEKGYSSQGAGGHPRKRKCFHPCRHAEKEAG